MADLSGRSRQSISIYCTHTQVTAHCHTLLLYICTYICTCTHILHGLHKVKTEDFFFPLFFHISISQYQSCHENGRFNLGSQDRRSELCQHTKWPQQMFFSFSPLFFGLYIKVATRMADSIWEIKIGDLSFDNPQSDHSWFFLLFFPFFFVSISKLPREWQIQSGRSRLEISSLTTHKVTKADFFFCFLSVYQSCHEDGRFNLGDQDWRPQLRQPSRNSGSWDLWTRRCCGVIYIYKCVELYMYKFIKICIYMQKFLVVEPLNSSLLRSNIYKYICIYICVCIVIHIYIYIYIICVFVLGRGTFGLVVAAE